MKFLSISLLLLSLSSFADDIKEVDMTSTYETLFSDKNTKTANFVLKRDHKTPSKVTLKIKKDLERICEARIGNFLESRVIARDNCQISKTVELNFENASKLSNDEIETILLNLDFSHDSIDIDSISTIESNRNDISKTWFDDKGIDETYEFEALRD